METLSHLKINVNVSELKQAAKQVQKAVAPELKDGAILGGDIDIAEEKKKLQKVMKQRQQAIDENLEYSQKIFDGASGNPFQLRAEELQKEQDAAQATLQSYKEMAKEARKTKQALESTVFGANAKTSYQYIGKDLTAVKQTITGTLDKITITTKVSRMKSRKPLIAYLKRVASPQKIVPLYLSKKVLSNPKSKPTSNKKAYNPLGKV